MKNVNFNTALSAAILVLALLFIAGTASAAIGDNDLDRSLIINGTNETQPLRDWSKFQSIRRGIYYPD